MQNIHADKNAENDPKVSRKNHILEAAAKLFSQQGYEGTSINAVAKASNTQKTLIQYHFSNKLRLWEATIAWVWQERDAVLPQYLNESMLQTLSEIDQRLLIKRLCESLLNFTFDHPHWVRLMFQEAATEGPRLDWMIEHFFKSDFENGLAMVNLAQEKELLPQVNHLDLLHILSGAIIYLVNVAPITAKVTGENPYSAEYKTRHIETLMTIFNSQLNGQPTN